MVRKSQAELERVEGRALTHLARVLKVKNEIKEQERRDDVRRKILMGSAGIELMRKDPELQRRCQEALDGYLASRPKEAELFAADKESDYAALLCEPERLAQLRRPSAAQDAPKGIAARALELRRAQDQEATDDTRRKIIVGGTFASLLRTDASLCSRMSVALKEGFTAKSADAGLFFLSEPVTYLDRLAHASVPRTKASNSRRISTKPASGGRAATRPSDVEPKSSSNGVSSATRLSSSVAPHDKAAPGSAGAVASEAGSLS